VAACSKETAAGIRMARSASRIAYSAKPPGRGLADVAIRHTLRLEHGTCGIRLRLTALQKSGCPVADFPLSNALTNFIDYSCNITPDYATWSCRRLCDVQRIDWVQSDVVNFDTGTLVRRRRRKPSWFIQYTHRISFSDGSGRATSTTTAVFPGAVMRAFMVNSKLGSVSQVTSRFYIRELRTPIRSVTEYDY
jgi:hypothetical protein